MYPLWEQPNQPRQSGSFNCHQRIIWQRRLSKIRLIKNTFFWYFDDNHYIIHTHHAWLSQMHSNLLISGVKTLTIARVLTLLITKFSCICEGQSWWVRITKFICNQCPYVLFVTRVREPISGLLSQTVTFLVGLVVPLDKFLPGPKSKNL